MQMEQESVIHVLSAKAKTWHAEVTQQTGQMKTQDWRPASSHTDAYPCPDLATPLDEALPEPTLGSTLSDKLCSTGF